jgi:hypothetical protein
MIITDHQIVSIQSLLAINALRAISVTAAWDTTGMA